MTFTLKLCWGLKIFFKFSTNLVKGCSLSVETKKYYKNQNNLFTNLLVKKANVEISLSVGGTGMLHAYHIHGIMLVPLLES